MITQLALLPSVKSIRLDRKLDKPRRLVGKILALGAGVQSSTLVEMIVEGDLPRVDLVVFSDTGNEPFWVYDNVDYLQKRLFSIGITTAVATNNVGLIEAVYGGDGRFATMPLFTKDVSGKVSQLRRQCTQDFKITPMNNVVLDWMIHRYYAKRITDKNGRVSRRVHPSVAVEYWFGISLDEFERSGRNRGPAWQIAKYPLIEKRMTRAACEQYLLNKNLPVPKKSSCIVCPFHDNNYWRDLKSNHPDLWNEACKFDEWLRTFEGRKRFWRIRDELYLHRSCVPLREVDFDQRTPLDHLICGDHCFT